MFLFFFFFFYEKQWDWIYSTIEKPHCFGFCTVEKLYSIDSFGWYRSFGVVIEMKNEKMSEKIGYTKILVKNFFNVSTYLLVHARIPFISFRSFGMEAKHTSFELDTLMYCLISSAMLPGKGRKKDYLNWRWMANVNELRNPELPK